MRKQLLVAVLCGFSGLAMAGEYLHPEGKLTSENVVEHQEASRNSRPLESTAANRLREGELRVAIALMQDPIPAATHYTDRECGMTWYDGQALPGGGWGDCFSTARGRGRMIVLYPRHWDGDPRLTEIVRITVEGMNKSFQIFSRFGRMLDDVQVLTLNGFDPERPPESGSYAVAWTEERDERCYINVYLESILSEEATHRQTVAHEMFHCFQYWNFYDQSFGPAGDEGWNEVIGWWAEGGAEYFSNVVYPLLNDEWPLISDFDAVSADTPITQMADEATVFWQFLANTTSNESLIALFRTLPSDRRTSQEDALAAGVPNIEGLFHEFGKQYLNREILDTGGEKLPVHPVYYETIRLESGDTAKIEPGRFVVGRASVVPVGDIRQTLTGLKLGPAGLASYREPAPRTWYEFPETRVLDCDEEEYLVLVTQTRAPDSTYGEFSLNVAVNPTVGPDPDIDPCAPRDCVFPSPVNRARRLEWAKCMDDCWCAQSNLYMHSEVDGVTLAQCKRYPVLAKEPYLTQSCISIVEKGKMSPADLLENHCVKKCANLGATLR